MLMSNSWRVVFPRLADISAEVSEILDKRTCRIFRQEGALIFGPDNPTKDLLLLVSGSVRIQQRLDDGRKIVLNRMHAGENCVLTAACLLASEHRSSEAVAETDLEAIRIPREVFDSLMSVSKEFRAFVFEDYSKQIADLFSVIEDAAIERVDMHVAQKLLGFEGMQPGLRDLEKQLAVEVGTTREVILRHLNEFERRGWVRFNQGQIQLRDVAALERLAQPPWLPTSAALSSVRERTGNLRSQPI